MTEAEARERWCPFVRLSNGPDGSWNRYMSNAMKPEDYNCVGSKCMAWRKDQNSKYDSGGDLRGFCGLAGKPE